MGRRKRKLESAVAASLLVRSSSSSRAQARNDIRVAWGTITIGLRHLANALARWLSGS